MRKALKKMPDDDSYQRLWKYDGENTVRVCLGGMELCMWLQIKLKTQKIRDYRKLLK